MSWRFSLRSLLTILTFLALGITCFVLNGRIRQLEQNLLAAQQKAQRMEVQLGLVLPGDPDQIQVLNLDQFDPHRWKWRLRLPDDSDYSLAFRCGQVVGDEFAERDGTLPLSRSPDDAGLIEVEMRWFREWDGRWQTMVRLHSRSITSPVPPAMSEWLSSPDASYQVELAGNDQTEQFSGEQPIPLLRSVPIPRLGMTPGKAVQPTVLPTESATDHGARLWLIRQRRQK